VAVQEPYPSLDEIIASIGEAGLRVSGIEASEGAAGNISVCVRWPIEVRRHFPLVEPIDLPRAVPALAGAVLIVTGSGRRLRDVRTDPVANLGAVSIDASGRSGRLFTSTRRLFAILTSEFNSHLAVHDDTVAHTGTNFHALIHAQPPHLVYLSHVATYRDEAVLNQRLLRWEPETIVNLPEGIGVLPFILPGSQALMEANVDKLRQHRLVLWGKHGVMARSDLSVTRAADRIDYAETAARYEYMDLACGGQGEGLTQDELRAVVKAFGVKTTIVSS
jgi:rhamnulose-1-phosphate aldolase